MPLIEAVPNLSEGRNLPLLHHLGRRLRQTPHVRLLGLDPNPCAHRTVFTLLGEPDALLEALFDLFAQAAQHLDMRVQHGAHPRLGAVDVCPLVPLQGVSLPQAAAYACALGQRVGQELHIPVYLYEAAATAPERKNLAFLRRGEYENLAGKLQKLPPDFGPHTFTPSVQKTGATVIGARPILIAFNINLNTTDVLPAQVIAARLRESNGGLKGVKAIGWYMENFRQAQVSCNITDFHAAPLARVFETCQRHAAQLGLQATGCELVGLAPLQALLQAGRHYAPAQRSPRALLQAAANGLNLNEVKPFDPQEQILEIKAGLAAY